MRNKKLSVYCVSMFSCLFMVACAALQSDYAPPPWHPAEEGEDLRYCTDCHDTDEALLPFEKFNHSTFFSENHNQISSRYGRTCNACHRGSFCSDCHGIRVELKPSIKNQTENYRRTPHRGDYQTRHFLEGRINPASCYRCHATPASSQTCNPCHG